MLDMTALEGERSDLLPSRVALQGSLVETNTSIATLVLTGLNFAIAVLGGTVFAGQDLLGNL